MSADSANYAKDDEMPMSDYLFKAYEKMRDENDALKAELTLLKNQGSKSDEMPMTDFQYKNLIEMIYQILKANFEAGRTPEEVLAIIAALKNESKGKDQ